MKKDAEDYKEIMVNNLEQKYYNPYFKILINDLEKKKENLHLTLEAAEENLKNAKKDTQEYGYYKGVISGIRISLEAIDMFQNGTGLIPDEDKERKEYEEIIKKASEERNK